MFELFAFWYFHKIFLYLLKYCKSSRLSLYLTYLLFLLFIFRNPTNYSCNINNRGSIWESLRVFMSGVDWKECWSEYRNFFSTTKSIVQFLIGNLWWSKPQDVFSKNKPKWIKYFSTKAAFYAIQSVRYRTYTPKLFLMHLEISQIFHRLPSTPLPLHDKSNRKEKVTSTLFIQTKSIRNTKREWMK